MDGEKLKAVAVIFEQDAQGGLFVGLLLLFCVCVFTVANGFAPISSTKP